MADLVVPRLAAGDTGCELVEWTVAPGARVAASDTVAILETAKASYDLAAGADGTIERHVECGVWIRFGSVIGRVVQGGEREASPVALPGDGEPPIPGLEDHRLSRNQAAVARTVLLSQCTIPTSFVLAKVPCDRAVDLLRRFSAEQRILAGLGELVVAVVARLATELPEMYTRTASATPSDPGNPNIGITVDVGKGLFIPVIKRAKSKNLRAICTELVEFRRRAYHNSFKADDLLDADISVSLSTAEGIVFAQPFVYPGQTCMLSLGGVQEESAGRVVHIGLAYDHRIVNGQQVVRFLGMIRAGLHDCDAVIGVTT